MNYVHYVAKPRYTFETCCTIEKKRSGSSWLTIFLRYTGRLLIALKNKWVIVSQNGYINKLVVVQYQK